MNQSVQFAQEQAIAMHHAAHAEHQFLMDIRRGNFAEGDDVAPAPKIYSDYEARLAEMAEWDKEYEAFKQSLNAR